MVALTKQELKEVWDSFASANGNLVPKDLHKLLRKVDLPADARSLVQAQGGLRHLNNGDSVLDPDGPGIDFALFARWYKLETSPGVYEHNNELLVRRVIENPKLPTRNLKEGAFVYGRKNVADIEGAGEVLLNWVVGQRSKSKEAGVSLIKVNREAVKQKYTTPKMLNKFLKEHMNDKNLQRPKILGKKKGAHNRDPTTRVALENIVPTKPVKPVPQENFVEILFPARTDPSLGREERPYVDTSGQCIKGKLPFPRQTKCTIGQRAHTKVKEDTKHQALQKGLWKMKKWDKVGRRTKLPSAPPA